MRIAKHLLAVPDFRWTNVYYRWFEMGRSPVSTVLVARRRSQLERCSHHLLPQRSVGLQVYPWNKSVLEVEHDGPMDGGWWRGICQSKDLPSCNLLGEGAPLLLLQATKKGASATRIQAKVA